MKRCLLLILPALLSFQTGFTSAQLCVTNLKCEMMTDPQGIDTPTPSLSWEIHAAERGVEQTGYDILVSSTREKLDRGEGDLWTGNGIASRESVYIPYGGRQLPSRSTSHWKVRVHTTRGTSEWSAPAFWSVGLLSESDWRAKWIGIDTTSAEDVLEGATRLSARYLRKEFAVRGGGIERATLYISGLGLYEAFVNAQRVGTQVLAPTLTDYAREVKYNTFDLTGTLKAGKNAIGVTLGNGRFFATRQRQRSGWMMNYGFPKLLLQLEITYADGSRQLIVSDDSWKITTEGPIRANNEYDGEEYDARMELTGWAEAGYDDASWLRPQYVQPPCYRLRGQMNYNIEIMDSIRPVCVTQPNADTYILDMGQNMVGWLRLKIRGEAGRQITMRFAEQLNPDGTLYLDNIREAKVTDKYTLKGEGTEQWEPAFTYRGFRYVEITGWPGTPAAADFMGKVVYDRMETIGRFESSDSTLNRIFRNAYRGIRGNYRSMPTDCPQRNERLGWLGDRTIGSYGESFLFDNNNLYAKWLGDINHSQLPDGSIGDIAPNYLNRKYSDNMTWPGTYVIVADMLYRQFGNRKPIEKHYASMKLWFDYMTQKYLTEHIMPQDEYGDWCVPPESPELIHSKDPARITEKALIGTAYYYHIAGLLSRFAGMLGKEADRREYANRADTVLKTFNDRFLNTEKNFYSNNTLTANLLPLAFGMVPESRQQRVADNVADKISNELGGHIATGLIGTQWLMKTLTRFGHSDIAYRIATNRDYPSWGYMIDNGATTLWELWNGNTADPAMNSHNHVMLLGDLLVWYYEDLAGICNSPGSAGFREITMKPLFQTGLTSVNASVHTVRGAVSSHWMRHRKGLDWEITIPCNASAKVYIPTSGIEKIRENDKPLAQSEGIETVGSENGCVVLKIGSGNYKFRVYP